MGSADLALSAQNTFTGTTQITSGTLTLLDSLALQNSTLDYDSTGGSIDFDLLTAVTLGGLSGDKNLSLLNSDAAPVSVALSVGGNGASTTFSGEIADGSSLTKVGGGTLTLAGVSSFSGVVAANGAAGTPDPVLSTLEIAASMTASEIETNAYGTILVTAGSSLASAFSEVFNDLIVDGGDIEYSAGLRGSNNDGTLFHVLSGNLVASSVELRRTGNYGADAAGPSVAPGAVPATGLVVSGGTATLGLLTIGTENSGAVGLVDGGDLEVDGAVTVGNTVNTRWSILEARSGTFQSNDTVSGIVLGVEKYDGVFSMDFVPNKAAFYVSGAVCTVEKITFGTVDATKTSTGLVDVSSGDLFIGAGGIVQASPSYDATIRLSGGNLGAASSWSTALPVTLADASNSYITGADEFGDPYDIELAGGLTGGGGVIKDGDGEVTVSGPITYTGDTQVWFGTLTLTSAGLADASNILVEDGSGAVLNLAFAGGDRVAEFADDSGTYTTGTVGAVGSGADHETAAVTGTGLLYLNEDPPVTAGYDSWATGAGLTGANNGPTQDAEFDGIDNVLEFVLGGDPLASDTDILPTLDASGANYVFSFTRDDESEAEVTLTFQYGSDLAGWTDVVIGADNGSSGSEVDIVEDGANPDQITITVPKSGTEMFGRLRAVK
ncbi:MAG: hypothetical protein KDN05_00120, partial [Verrucomicrobiae bacterium]|nr:hypothetical protein [Verrucomicrobiae bacterium]